MDHLDIARLLDARRSQIIDHTVASLLEDPFWRKRFGSGIAERLALDFDLNLANLAKGIRYRSPMLLDDHMLWRRKQLLGWGCSTGHAREVFAHKWAAISEYMPREALPMIYDYIQSAMHALDYTIPNVHAVAAVHDQLAEDLVCLSYDSHWHWQAAYGAQQRTQMLHDTWFLIDYTIDALGNKSDQTLGRYLCWKRDDNLTRGLATTHMQQLVWLLAEAARQRLQPGPLAEMQAMLEKGVAYLFYNNESCRVLMAAQDQIVAEVAQQLTFAGLAPQPHQAALEIGWYLSYLNDSLAHNDAEPLINYTRWMQHWFASQGLPDAPLRQSYAAIGTALERYLPQYAARDAGAVLHAAQNVL